MSLEDFAIMVGKALLLMAATYVVKAVVEEAIQKEFKVTHEQAALIVGAASVGYDIYKQM